MKVYDLHCDVLLKISESGAIFYDDVRLDINYKKLKEGEVKVQAMAIFVDPDIPSQKQYDEALRQVEIYKSVILAQPGIKQLTHLSQIHDLKEDEIGTFLTLEGLDCIGNDIHKLEHLIDQGVLLVGMTWNSINHACDGIGEKRGAGLSSFGYEVVGLLNEHNIIVDVAHISEQGFEDVMKAADHVICSHGNTQKYCSHKRNLSDEQLKKLIAKKGHIHLVYLPLFIRDDAQSATLDELGDHLAYLLESGYEDFIGLGSDFDGIHTKVVDLEDASKTQNFIDYLEARFGKEITEKVAYKNFMRYVDEQLS